eukprot:COSAG01_NODE_66990_length_268_cov_0.899408_1_plen_77_part_01
MAVKLVICGWFYPSQVEKCCCVICVLRRDRRDHSWTNPGATHPVGEVNITLEGFTLAKWQSVLPKVVSVLRVRCTSP